MEYRFTLKDNNQKAFRSFVWFLFFLHLVAAAILVLKKMDKYVKLDVYILLGFYAVICLVYYIFRNKRKAFENFSFLLALLYANFWMKHAGMLAMFVFLAIFVFGLSIQHKKTKVVVLPNGLQLTRLYKTDFYDWDKLENVVLKDNLLTIDFKTNKLVQAEIEESKDIIEEHNFNQFCKEYLKHEA